MPMIRMRYTAILLIILTMFFATFAAVRPNFWINMLHVRSGFRPELYVTLEWMRCSAALAAVVSALLSTLPKLRAFLWSRWGIFLFPLVSIVLFLWYKDFAGPENGIYIAAVREDSLAEYLTALFFFGAAILSALLTIRLGRSKLILACFFFAGMTGLTLFMGLEEISYGQRIFGIETPPEIAADNTQKELNLHNLKSLKWIAEDIVPGIIIKWGLFGWAVVYLSKILPSSLLDLKFLIKLVFPSWYVAPYFLPFAAWAYHSFYLWLWPSAVWQDQEPAEMFLGLAFLVFCCTAFFHIGKSDLSPHPRPR